MERKDFGRWRLTGSLRAVSVKDLLSFRHCGKKGEEELIPFFGEIALFTVEGFQFIREAKCDHVEGFLFLDIGFTQDAIKGFTDVGCGRGFELFLYGWNEVGEVFIHEQCVGGGQGKWIQKKRSL